MARRDLKKELKHLYNPTAKEITVVDVPAMNFLMINGEGDPNTAQQFKDAVGCLYALSYTLKFMIKKAKGGVDYGVMPLEGLWWAKAYREASRNLSGRPAQDRTGEAEDRDPASL